MAFIEISAAELADAFAILFAQNLAGQSEENILTHERIKLEMHILDKNQLVVFLIVERGHERVRNGNVENAVYRRSAAVAVGKHFNSRPSLDADYAGAVASPPLTRTAL